MGSPGSPGLSCALLGSSGLSWASLGSPVLFWARLGSHGCPCVHLGSHGGPCFIYGKLRRTDFLPVGEPKPEEILERGYESVDSDDEEGKGLEYAFDPDEDVWDALDMSKDPGNLLNDF